MKKIKKTLPFVNPCTDPKGRALKELELLEPEFFGRSMSCSYDDYKKEIEDSIADLRKIITLLFKTNSSTMRYWFLINHVACLLDGKPLTYIQESEDIWLDSLENDEYKCQNCMRYFDLGRRINKITGEIHYFDRNRFRYLTGGKVAAIEHTPIRAVRDYMENELLPITFPYFPSASKIDVYLEDFLFDRRCGDFDTIRIVNYRMYGSYIPVNMCFREVYVNDKDSKIIRISLLEYRIRKLFKKDPSKRHRVKRIMVSPNAEGVGCAPDDGPACEASCKECTNCIRESEETNDGSENKTMP